MTTSFESTIVSTSGGPDILFRFEGDTCRAELAGAKLYAESHRKDGGIDMRVTDATGFVLAKLVVLPRMYRDDTENLTDIGSALLWSHWRWSEAKRWSEANAAANVLDRIGDR